MLKKIIEKWENSKLHNAAVGARVFLTVILLSDCTIFLLVNFILKKF